MLRKVAIALVAASMLAAPVMAQTPAATDTKPAAAAPSTATTTDKSAPSTTVKANKSKSSKHSRALRNTRTVSHKSVTMVKHARHFDAAKSHKVAGAARIVAHKPAMTVKHARHFNGGKGHKVAHAAKSTRSPALPTRSCPQSPQPGRASTDLPVPTVFRAEAGSSPSRPPAFLGRGFGETCWPGLSGAKSGTRPSAHLYRSRGFGTSWISPPSIGDTCFDFLTVIVRLDQAIR